MHADSTNNKLTPPSRFNVAQQLGQDIVGKKGVTDQFEIVLKIAARTVKASGVSSTIGFNSLRRVPLLRILYE
ncbi:MAG TPA: hypothetical protein VK503_03180 [Candidatus Bathyarchaeia archaeon]|nr:hypothetical protein [Candidatus Bathyarchaeia archaeon]